MSKVNLEGCALERQSTDLTFELTHASCGSFNIPLSENGFIANDSNSASGVISVHPAIVLIVFSSVIPSDGFSCLDNCKNAKVKAMKEKLDSICTTSVSKSAVVILHVSFLAVSLLGVECCGLHFSLP